MPKIYIREKNKMFPIIVDFEENIKSLLYSYEYIFEKSHKYKVMNKCSLKKLEIKKHCFFKGNEIILFYKNFNKKFKILDIDVDNIYIYSKELIKNGYAKLNERKNIKNLIYKSTILDYRKQFKEYYIKENSIISCC